MNVSLDLLAPAAERIAWTLIHSLWQGAVIAIICAVALGIVVDLVINRLRREAPAVERMKEPEA